MRPNGYVSVVWVIVLAALMAGCGSSSSSSGQPKPTGLTKRVLLSNQQSNTVNLLNAQKDVFTTKNIGAVAPTKLVTAGGQTVVLDSTQNDLTVIDNTKEAASFGLLLNDVAFDIALTPDGKTVFAAERNSSAVQFATTDNGGVSPTVIHVPSARRVVMSPTGTRLLVFSDPQAQLAGDTHSFYIIDTASKGIIQVQSPNLDQPFTAIFGAGDDQAFILNCGAECGGISASVTLVNFRPAERFQPFCCRDPIHASCRSHLPDFPLRHADHCKHHRLHDVHAGCDYGWPA
jgi:DNA-binding beta-propeller fold protein YncE